MLKETLEQWLKMMADLQVGYFSELFEGKAFS